MKNSQVKLNHAKKILETGHCRSILCSTCPVSVALSHGSGCTLPPMSSQPNEVKVAVKRYINEIETQEFIEEEFLGYK